MFVAVCDQNFGNSTLFWSKTALSLPGMKASRSSHSTSSNGSRPGIVKKRCDADRRGVVDDGVHDLVDGGSRWLRMLFVVAIVSLPRISCRTVGCANLGLCPRRGERTGHLRSRRSRPIVPATCCCRCGRFAGGFARLALLGRTSTGPLRKRRGGGELQLAACASGERRSPPRRPPSGAAQPPRGRSAAPGPSRRCRAWSESNTPPIGPLAFCEPDPLSPFEPPPPPARCRSRPTAVRAAGSGRWRRRCRPGRDPLLERLLDVVPRARVRVHVGRQVLERVPVAVDRVGAVDPAVVPVVDQDFPARRRALRFGRGRSAVPTASASTACKHEKHCLEDVPGRMDHGQRRTAPGGRAGRRRFAFGAL